MAETILITNDDGVFAEGIQVLCQTLFPPPENLRYDILVVAPNHEQSAVGHAITMHRPLRAEKIRFLHNPELEGWSVNGTPSDCVKLAVEAILPEKPRLVISGINRGSNLGTDVLYSGTVSAAVEGIILGIPSLAVSLTEGDDFSYGAGFIHRLLPHILKSRIPSGTLLNINIPAGGAHDIKGVKATVLGRRRYRNVFERRTDPRGRVYYWLAGELVEEKNGEGTDVQAVMDRYISITPVCFNLTNDDFLPELTKIVDRLP